MNAKQKKLIGKIAVFALAGTVAGGQIAGLSAKPIAASADEATDEIIYYEDIVYGNDVFEGQGTQTSSTYTIPCDEKVLVAGAFYPSMPSFSTVNDNTMSNYCGAMAGRNIVGFYDRWYTNLIPNYDPGFFLQDGTYFYYGDYAEPETNLVVEELYDAMLIGEVGGTTSQNFKNGLRSYVSGKGYNTSYSSFYSSATTVNLNKLTTAVNQNKVGVVMCSQYNFVYGILFYQETEEVRVSRVNSTTAHMMMVYGYETWAFYKDGNHVTTKTFLAVCSGFGDGAIGYMELNDFSVINEAVIVTIS